MQTLQQLLAPWETDGTLGPERLQQIDRALVQDRQSDMPWYLRFLIGLGAWLASAFFIGFFIVLIGWEDKYRETIGASGLVVLGVATVLFRQKLGLFVSQCCLAASFAGQFMIYFGFLPENHHTLGSAVVLSIGLAAVLYWLYPDVLQRLVTCLAALQITLAWIYLGNNGERLDVETQLGQETQLLPVLYWALHLAGIAWCFMRVSRQSALLVPFGYALVLSMTAWQLELLGGFPFQHFAVTSIWLFYLRSICTAVTLFGVVVWAAGGVAALRQFMLPLACLALTLIAIIWLGPGGVVLPLLLITLGFFVESSVILGIGLILLPIFLATYYYNLHLDLLAKSVALIGSGLALLLLRAGLRRWLTVETKETS